uniref:Zinc finger and AT-hook domain containing n=1 Tax=Lates calcarifer TaxID=8187 RepID=A0A4W6C3T5_LATCA
MCRLCNLFSPSRSLLLDHCSQLHAQQEPPDDIIIALQPLVAEPISHTVSFTHKYYCKYFGWFVKHTVCPALCALTLFFPLGESHDGILGLECKDCHRSFSNRRQIRKHICLREEEEEEEEDEEQNGEELKSLLQSQLKIFACEFCNKIFKFRHSLIAHLRTHTQEKPFQCPHCDYASAIKANLNVHLRKHTGEKFNCQHCPFNCLSPGHLKVHIERVHLKVKQHCSFCEKKYSDVKNLLKHIEKRCDLQYLKFKFICISLSAHVRKHLFLYVCCVCDGKFVSSQRLKSHLKESHPELDQEQAFTDCINNSYYLIQPGGGIGIAEEVQVTELETGKEGEIENGGVQKDSQGVISEETTDRQDEATAGEPSQANTTDSCTPIAQNTGRHEHNTQTFLSPESIHISLLEDRTQKNTHVGKKIHTTSSSGNADVPGLGVHIPLSSSAPLGEEDQTPHSEKSEIFHQSAFQQVFSSLQKTQLNMETFQRLRKIYGDLECQYCGKLFWYKVHYNVHVRTHTKEHLHYCTKCSYSSITKSSLKRHQIQKHSGLLLPCSNPSCKYTTPDKYKLQAHLRTHQEQTVACPVCKNSYPEHRLKHHIKTSHPDTLPVQGKGLMVQRAEKCPYCDSYFLKNSSDFQQHIWAHQGLKPYLCNVCDYAGRSRSNLKTHMNRHNTERRHLCDLCGKKFKSKVTLKSHRLSHTNEGKRFQCSECDFTSVSKPSLLRHMEQHAEFKPFRCAHCHYSCNIAGPLKRHYNLKHPDQKYENAGPGLPNADALKQQGGIKCPECEFVYGTKWELNRHLKSKHSLKVVEGTWEVADEQEVSNCSNQLMVVNAEGGLTGDQVMVVEDAHGLEALTVLTQGENAHHYIVYVQEHTVEIN